jgi:TolA-binding protein
MAQVTPDQAAALVLNSARKAYNEQNYPFAVTRFREFLAKYGGHKEAPAARYGLALSLLELPERDYAAVIQELQPLAGNQGFADYPYVLYYLGLAQRGLGTREIAQAEAKPQEAPQRRATAQQRFEEASKQFTAALAAFTAKNKPPKADAKELPVEWEWAARARCDLAEMQLRTLKTKEALVTATPFVKDQLLTKSKYHGLGLYYHGFASFLLADYLTAGRSLNELTPFNDSVYGTHARYLLARTHHLTSERAEAAGQYEKVLTDYEQHKKDAAQALTRPETFKNDRSEKERLEALVRDPPPDHVARATFFLAVLLYEQGRFADALTRFTAFSQQFAKSSLLPEAQLRIGFCQVQLRQYAEATKILQPLADKEPRLADQALFWIGKSQVGAADPANAPAYAQALRTALDTFRRAADRAQQQTGTDPGAKARRGEMLLELADTQQLAKQFKEAAATYNQIVNEKILPQREEECVQRQATALHLAGDFAGSDQVCQRFQQQYPKSSLLPAVLFRQAENAYFTALEAGKNPSRAQEAVRLHEEAAKRYKVVVDKFPEFAYVNLARYGLAMATYHKGQIDKAQEILEAIPQPERNGDLAVVSYALADCLIRQAPAKADDALAAGKLQEKLQAAIELLDTYVGSQPNAAQTPDALLKLGYSHQRLAALIVQPQERAKIAGNARSAYERLIQQFPNHELRPQATLERAKCLALAGDMGGAMNELQRFTNDAQLKAAPVAPMALLQLATWQRGQNKPQDAANTLAQCRQQYEGALQKDPARLGWVPLLHYHQGVALQEAGKLTDARTIFDQVARQYPSRPEGAEAALRWSQCMRAEAEQKIATARKGQVPNAKPEELAAANRVQEEGLKLLRDASTYLDGQINQVKNAQPTWEVRARMIYESAWGNRMVAEAELAAARAKLQQERLKKLQDEAAKKAPPGQPPVDISPPEVPLPDVPLQPAEQKARGQYQSLIAGFPDLPLATDARFELAELLAEREDYDGALKLLNEGLDKEPPAELADKFRLRLGECYAAKGDPKKALAQFDTVARDPKNPLAGQAHYRAGECLIQMKDWAKAAARLAVFRDQQPFQNLPGLTDRALLRLGYALAEAGQWDQSRQAYEVLVARFGSSPWVHAGRYGVAWAWQNQKQYDNAVNVYTQVAAETLTEIGAKAQLQIGLCRLEQKRYQDALAALLVVPFSYDYPELSAVALCEAGRTLAELKQPDRAIKVLEKVIKDHPKSKWAQVARERLGALKRG